jgi:hypothetical protein
MNSQSNTAVVPLRDFVRKADGGAVVPPSRDTRCKTWEIFITLPECADTYCNICGIEINAVLRGRDASTRDTQFAHDMCAFQYFNLCQCVVCNKYSQLVKATTTCISRHITDGEILENIYTTELEYSAPPSAFVESHNALETMWADLLATAVSMNFIYQMDSYAHENMVDSIVPTTTTKIPRTPKQPCFMQNELLRIMALVLTTAPARYELFEFGNIPVEVSYV